MLIAVFELSKTNTAESRPLFTAGEYQLARETGEVNGNS
jgi:hypothetical protein